MIFAARPSPASHWPNCSEAEIATITGHSLRDVGAILDAHYLKRDHGLGVTAIRKREEHEAATKIPN